MSDPVNKPAHYTRGSIEPLDFILDQGLGFCRGQIIKYVVRAGYKDPAKEVEDLLKAKFYLEREIARAQDDAFDRATVSTFDVIDGQVLEVAR